MKLKVQLVFTLILTLFAVPSAHGFPVDNSDETAAKEEAINQLKLEVLSLQQRLAELMARLENISAGTPAATAATPAAVPGNTAAFRLEPAVLRFPPKVASVSTTDSLIRPLAPTSTQGLYGDSTTDTSATLNEKVQVGGYGSFRYEANSIAPAAQIAGHPQVQRGYNSFDFRRFVLTIDANPTDRLRFYTEIEFERLSKIEIERTALPENRGTGDRAGIRFIQEVEGQDGSEIAMEQAWAQFDFNSVLSARMGVILPPVGRFNIRHDDNAWDIPRRSLVDRGGPVLPVKAAWSELGAGLVGSAPVGDGFLDYQFYIVNGVQLDFTLEEVVSLREGRNLLELEPEIAFSSGPFNGTNTADALTWRFGYTPRLGHEIAFSGYHGEYTPDYLLVNSWINTLAVDGKTTVGKFEVEGEFVYTDFGRLEAVLSDLATQAVDAAAATTSAETATLETEVEAEFAGPLTNQRYGFWVDFKYRFWPEGLNETFLGRGFENPQLVPIVRFERIWFNDFVRSFDFAGGVITDLTMETLSQQRTTVGLTYRPTDSVGFSFAWENNRRMQGSTLIFPSTLGLGRVPDKSYNALIIGTVFGF